MKNKWGLFIILYISAFAVSASQLKFVPILGDIAAGMNISLTQTSLLMSVFTIAGIILAVPGGALLAKIGPKRLLLFLIGALIIGNFLGAFFYTNYPIFLISRIIEGIAFSMIIMVGVVLISGWFAGGNVGLAVGIFTTFPGAASAVWNNICVPISSNLGTSSLWLIVGTLALICLILVSIFIKAPKTATADAQDSSPQMLEEKPSIKEAFMNSKMWLLAICQGCAAFVLFTFITIYPTLFTSYYQLSPTTANFYASLNGLFGIPFCIISGILIDKTGKPATIILLSFILMTVTCFITAMLGTYTYVMHTLLTAIACGFVIAAVLAAAPSIAKKPVLIGYTVAFVNLIYYIGVFIGSPATLAAVEGSGWQAGANVLTIVSAIGFIFALVFIVRNMRKKST